MPDTEPMTQDEMTQTVHRIEQLIDDVSTQIDRMPDGDEEE